MASTVDNRKAVDAEKVADMRRLLAEGGDRAVEKRYGEAALKSAEYSRAQRQRQATAQRTGEARREAVSRSHEQKERSRQSKTRDDSSEGRPKTAARGGKEDARERAARLKKEMESRRNVAAVSRIR